MNYGLSIMADFAVGAGLGNPPSSRSGCGYFSGSLPFPFFGVK